MPVSGDVADVRILEDDTAVIDCLEPRAFSLERRTIGGRSKVMAANVDTLVTVTALKDPAPRTIVLDQLLAFAQMQSLGAVVCFTKADLVDDAARRDLESIYTQIGYPVITLNPRIGENVGALEAALYGKRALVAGISGVGKSSLFAALGGEATVGSTSRHGMGRQTTTAARLHRTGGGGFLIDSPGVNEFGLGEIEAPELAAAFPEIRERSARCRFNNCSHLHEPGCAVQTAAAAGEIAPTRYASYRKILTEPT